MSKAHMPGHRTLFYRKNNTDFYLQVCELLNIPVHFSKLLTTKGLSNNTYPRVFFIHKHRIQVLCERLSSMR